MNLTEAVKFDRRVQNQPVLTFNSNYLKKMAYLNRRLLSSNPKHPEGIVPPNRFNSVPRKPQDCSLYVLGSSSIGAAAKEQPRVG